MQQTLGDIAMDMGEYGEGDLWGHWAEVKA